MQVFKGKSVKIFKALSGILTRIFKVVLLKLYNVSFLTKPSNEFASIGVWFILVNNNLY